MKEVKSVYTTQEAAETLACHPETVRRAIRKDELKAVGKNPYRISAAELERWWKEKGGGEIDLSFGLGGISYNRIENPVDEESVVDLARRLARGIRTLSRLAQSLEVEDQLPDVEAYSTELSHAADKIEESQD